MLTKYQSDLKPVETKRKFSLCKLCKARIFWTVTINGKNMPIDYDEKIEYLFDGIAKVPYESSIMKAHWGSCPYAKQLRRD